MYNIMENNDDGIKHNTLNVPCFSTYYSGSLMEKWSGDVRRTTGDRRDDVNCCCHHFGALSHFAHFVVISLFSLALPIHLSTLLFGWLLSFVPSKRVFQFTTAMGSFGKVGEREITSSGCIVIRESVLSGG